MDEIEGFFPRGRTISPGKSGYIGKNPKNLVAFNANLCVRSRPRPVWTGDLDVTLDGGALMRLAASLGEDVFVLRESAMHGAGAPDLSRAIAVVSATDVRTAERGRA